GPARGEAAASWVGSGGRPTSPGPAGAPAVHVEVAADETMLRVSVRDDGRGGAGASHGSGLTGLADRVEALGGRVTLHSPPGAGTALEVRIPLARGPSGGA